MEGWDCLEAERMFVEKEWSDEGQAVYVLRPSLSGSVHRPCWHPLQHEYRPTNRPTSAPAPVSTSNSLKFFFFFSYTAGGVISGCVKMSEHDCWSKNVQTRCVSRIINQQLLILGKQSSPQPGCVGLAPMHRFHQRGKRCVFISFPIYIFFTMLFLT